MRWGTRGRWFRNSLLAVVCLSLAVYLARDFVFFRFLYRATRADWELSQIRNECFLARDEFAEQARRSRASPRDVEHAKKRLAAREATLRERCLTLARENPATQAELTALFLVVSKWPKTQDGEDARGKLLELAGAADMTHWGEMFKTNSEPNDESLRPLASALVRRVKENPDHPAAASMLTAACNMVAPDTDVNKAPPAFEEIADLIAERYARSPDIVNFTERFSTKSLATTPSIPHVYISRACRWAAKARGYWARGMMSRRGAIRNRHRGASPGRRPPGEIASDPTQGASYARRE